MLKQFKFQNTGLYLPEQFHLMLHREVIQMRILTMAEAVNKHMQKAHDAGMPMTSISLLNGALPFFADIRRHFFPGHLPIALSAASRKGQLSVGLKIAEGVLAPEKIKGRVIYLFDDIIDSAKTMFLVKQLLMEMGALQVITIALLDKPAGREDDYKDVYVDIAGFVIPFTWVWGYGMDEGHGIEYEWVRNTSDIFNYGEQVSIKDIIIPDLAELPLAA